MPKRIPDTRPIYYVYILFDWLAIPRYIGKGKKDRIDGHEKQSSKINWLKNEFIEQTWIMLGEIPKLKIRENITEIEAIETEVALITAIGRIDIKTGQLTNLTDGGEGLSGFQYSNETKVRLAKLSKDRMLSIPIEERRKIAIHAAMSVENVLWINNKTINKRLRPGEPIPDGWEYGRLYEASENFLKSAAKTKWIHKGENAKRLPHNQPIPYGWKLGRKSPKEKPFCLCGCNRQVLHQTSKWARGHALRRTTHQNLILEGRLKISDNIH